MDWMRRMMRANFFVVAVAVTVLAAGVMAIGLAGVAAADGAGRERNGPAAKSLEARRAELDKLVAEEWEYELRESPETATIIGDYRYNDKWSDASLAHVQVRKQDAQKWIARLGAIDTAGFPEQEKLTHELLLRTLKERVEGIDMKTYEMPVDQFNGVQLQFPQFSSIVPLDSTKHYEDYLTRLRAIPTVMDQVIEILRRGEKDKMMPPRFLLEKAAEQCKSIGEPAGEASVFALPVKNFPAGVPEADRKRLHDDIIAAVDGNVRPAYEKLRNFLVTDYAPKGRTEPGVSALPNGAALYRLDIRLLTTTNMEPEAIHQLGLREVARIEADQLAIAKKMGFSDLPSFRVALSKNPKLMATSREQILDKFREYIAQMQLELPKLFGMLPKTQVEIRPVQEYREKEASTEYLQGTPDGSRPGIIYVNTGDFAHRTLTDIEATAYHEGVPGHHMQISIAQTLPGLPPFRQQAGYNAYAEGWALYSERLGKEVGFYKDPYSDYGRLSEEMLRAVRLVVDTGVHSKKWTRQQVVDYFHAHTSEDEPEVQEETDRYIAWPAQALGYKLGQLDILRLREKAKAELGAKFDIRKFHDEILDGGALPLDVMDRRVDAWITAQKK
ncbi:MAG TPA: DUF885 family protein [Candidatus Acidoferrum sp.]|jgi:uncharacterized protein (DUF885 family)